MAKIIGTEERTERAYNPEETVESNENETPETPRELTVEAIEEFFIQQGNLIEGQLKAEDVYKNCPVCAAAKNFLAKMGAMLEDSLRRLELERNMEEAAHSYTGSDSLDRLKRDNEWYDLARSALIGLLQAGHMPNKVMHQHPDLVVTKHKRRSMKSGKHRRQLAREARRNNR